MHAQIKHRYLKISLKIQLRILMLKTHNVGVKLVGLLKHIPNSVIFQFTFMKAYPKLIHNLHMTRTIIMNV